jgi:hypothetical protein
MSSRQVLYLLLISIIVTLTIALNIDVPAHENECFYEELGYGDKLTVTYQVKLYLLRLKIID